MVITKVLGVNFFLKHSVEYNKRNIFFVHFILYHTEIT